MKTNFSYLKIGPTFYYCLKKIAKIHTRFSERKLLWIEAGSRHLDMGLSSGQIRRQHQEFRIRKSPGSESKFAHSYLRMEKVERYKFIIIGY